MKKRIAIIVMTVICAVICAVGFVACSEIDPSTPSSHAHSYAWTDNGDGTHNGHCLVEGCDKPYINNEPHIWSGDGKCTKCKSVKPNDTENPPTHTHSWSNVWSNNDTHHWHNCTASGCDITDNAQKDGYGSHTPGAVATETTPQTCTVCGYVITPPLGHTHSLTSTPAKDPDCTTDGNITYWYCLDCDKYFLDKNGNNEITLADTVRQKLGHDTVHHDGQAATCTAAGWNAYDTCSRCSYTTKTEIPALGHSTVHHDGQAATCTAVGWNAYDTCSRCSHTTKTEIPALGHQENEYTTCTVCGITVGTVGLSYDLNSNGASYYVKGMGMATGTNIFIASEYNGKPVTSIGSSAFKNCNSLTSITIPNSVTSIGSSAFRSCSSLTSITIPNSVTSIGNSAFSGCPIETATIPAIACSYIKNSALKTVVITSGTSIGSNAFYNCSGLTSITIPNSVTSIEYDAFSGCISLTSITIPDGVTSIGYYAFYNCSGLTSITIPNGVTSIGYSAFSGCSSLASMTVTSGNILYHSSGNCLIETSSKTLIAGCKTSVIPTDGSVMSIGDHAFYGCNNLTSIEIPNSVTSIGVGAFYGCSSLTIMKIPNSVTSIGREAFYNCSSLTSAIIGSGVKVIEEWTFYNCLLLKDIKLNIGLKTIKQQSFELCGVQNLIIPNSVNTIEYMAFPCCKDLTFVYIPSSVTNVGQEAFRDCNKIDRIYCNQTSPWNSYWNVRSSTRVNGLGEPLDPVYHNVVYKCLYDGNVIYRKSDNAAEVTVYKLINNGCAELVVPSLMSSYKVTSIGSSAFSGCNSLTGITIPNSVTSIGSSAFFGCNSLTSITIPNSVTSIGSDAFRGCSSLTSITIPNSVTTIGSSAFSGCSKLESITLPFVGGSAYPSYNDNEYPFGYVFGTSSYTGGTATTQLYYFGGSGGTTKTTYYIPTSLNSVTIKGGSVLYGAFSGCSNLTSIEIPNSVTSIGSYAFHDCSNLTSITIPDSVTSIVGSAFSGCDKLQYNEYNNGLYLGNETNKYVALIKAQNTLITTFGIHSNTKTVANDAFSDCSNLSSITVAADNSNYASQDGILYNKAKTRFIHIPKTINGAITIPDSVTSIGSSAFSGCSSLTSITIPGNVTSIGDSAFSGCSSLTSITIPSGVTSIGYKAFYGCSGLTCITLPFVGASIKTSSDTYQYPFGYIFGTSSYTGGTATEQHYYGSSTSNTTNITYYIPTSLTNVTITGGNILYGSFSGCSSLTSITIPSGLTSIGYKAFYGCSSLTSITIPFVGASKDGTSNTHFGYIFGANSYSDNSSYVPSSLKTVIITGGTSIGNHAFYYCSSLMSITIPDSVASIGDYAFSGCSSLTSISIPDSVTSIGSSAFYDCNSLTSIYYIGDIANWCAISGLYGLMSSSRTLYISGKELTGELVIPYNVTSIGDSAFSGCSSLTSITIPNSVTSIGSDAFRGCSGLTSITLPFVGSSKNGTSNTHFGYIFGANSYSDNSSYVPSSLKTVVITGGTSIGNHAFYYCSSLMSITIPDSVASIGGSAFYKCSSLTSVTFQGSIAQWNAISKGSSWNYSTGDYTVKCTDGNIAKSNS